jgi:hypothetical protein
MKSLLLDPDAWDLSVDGNGNIALADEPLSLAQDVACAVRTFKGELWFDTVPGLPYFSTVLGKSPPPLALLKASVVAAAKSVKGVTAATCYISSFENRVVRGQIKVTDVVGKTFTVGF